MQLVSPATWRWYRRRKLARAQPAADPELSAGTFHELDTTATNNFGPDGMNWAQAWPICMDEYGKLILMCQTDAGGGLIFVYSNDSGLTWEDNTGNTNNAQDSPFEAAITR